MGNITFARGIEGEKKQSRLGKINFKLKAIISTSTMSNTVTLAQLERMNGMIE